MKRGIGLTIMLLLVLWMSEPSFAWDFSIAGKDMNLPYYLGFNANTKTLGIQLYCDKEFAVAVKTNNGTWPLSPTLEKAPITVNVTWYYKGPEPQSSWPSYLPNLPGTGKFDLVGPFPDGAFRSAGNELKSTDFDKDGTWTFKACTTVFPNNCAYLDIAVAGSKPTPTAKMSDQKPADVVAKPAPAILDTLAKPHLSVVGAQANIDPACQHLFLSSITIKNTGGALAAGKGTVNVKSNSGQVSGAVSLPAFGMGETHVVKVPVGTPKDFGSYNPGTLAFYATLNPQTQGGQTSFVTSDPFQTSVIVTFPEGSCQTPKAAGSKKDRGGSQLPAGQQAPAQQKRR